MPATVAADEGYDYFSASRTVIRNGVQAILMCNGLFTSRRSLEQVFAQELAYMEWLGGTVGTPSGGDWVIYPGQRTVGVGAEGTRIHAAFREGIGCVVMAPDQDLDDINKLPQLELPLLAGDPATIPWPDGDLVTPEAFPEGVDRLALQAASDWAFERESEEEGTISLMVLQGDQILHERYAPGFNMRTRTRTWSTAKGIAVTLIGMLVDLDKLALDEPLGIEWLPGNSKGNFLKARYADISLACLEGYPECSRGAAWEQIPGVAHYTYLNTPTALYPFDLKARYAYSHSCVGHRYSLH